MKFRIIMSVVLVAALVFAVSVTGESTPDRGASPAPSSSSDDKALKSLSIN